MKRSAQLGAAIVLLLNINACGIVQATKDSAVDGAKWAFTTPIKTLNIDLTGRAALNPSSTGQSLSTVIRVYQLKTAKTFEKLDYAQLQHRDVETLQPDLLATTDLVLRPDTRASITEPMHSDAEYIGIVAFFRDTDQPSEWKLVLPRKQWKKTDPVKIEVRENFLTLREE